MRKISCLFLCLLFAGCATTGDFGVEPLAVEADLSRSTVYPNEQVLLTHQLYTRYDTRYEGFEKEPLLPFQWFEDFPATKDVERKIVRRNGAKYVEADIRLMALFPMRPGRFTLQPGVIKLGYKTRRFQGDYTPDTLSHMPVTLQALDFPAGQPDDFNGFCGQFSVSNQAMEVTLEDVTLTLEVRGTGNVRQFPMPLLDLPQGLKLMTVEEKADIQFLNREVTGVKTFKIHLRPEKSGRFKIPAPHFSTFNPGNGSYVTVRGKELAFEAAASAPVQTAQDTGSGTQLHILFDISGSMLAQDFKPLDRISVAKNSLGEFLSDDRMKDVRTALSSFAKNVTEVWGMEKNSPRHLDLLDHLQTTFKDSDGTATGSALYQAVKAFDAPVTADGKKAILLLTDGSRNAGYIDALTAARLAAEKSIPVYALAIGRGGLVPFPVQDPLYGQREIQAEVNVDRDAIREIAQVTGGKYFEIRSEADFKTAVQELAAAFAS